MFTKEKLEKWIKILDGVEELQDLKQALEKIYTTMISDGEI